MNPDKAAIRTYFAKLGLEAEIADVYLALHAQGPQTISELSRSANIERTRIYRLIDQLMDSGLIEVETQYKRGILKAAPISNLRILITKREQELEGLQDGLQLIEQVLGRNSLSSPSTRVQFYKGPEGLKQMFWNETKATTNICGILYENIQIKAGSRFFERWVDACNQKEIHFRGIVSQTFHKSQQAWYGVEASQVKQRLKHWQARSVDADTFPIRHSTIIYNNVVGYFNWQDNETFGIEIYNQHIAESQRLFYDLLWNSLETSTNAPL